MTENNGHHCLDHEEYHAAIVRVATNTDWIISALKMGSTVLGVVFTAVIIPASIWMINLDKRVTYLENHIAYLVKK